MSKNYYEILEIKPNATKEEIKSSYKKLARKYHPDINKMPGAEEKFKEINSAADILLDDTKRRQYDILMGLNTCFKEENKKEEFEENEQKEFKKEKYNFDFKKIIKHIQNRYRANKSKERINGKDIYMEVKITPQEALLGCDRKINLIHTERCPKCEGRRFVNGTICKECNGMGHKITHNKIKVKIPKCIKNNTKIKLKGEGNKGQNGGIDGNLYLTVKIEGVEKVLKEVFITPSEALFGATINVKLEENSTVKLEIPKNTNPGQCFEVINKNKGNQEVTVRVVVKIPKDISEEEKKLYKKLSEYDINKKREELF